MKIDDTRYMAGRESFYLVPSKSFKKELIRNLSKDLLNRFGIGLDLKKIIGLFGHINHRRLGVEPSFFDLHPTDDPRVSKARMFTIVYSPHFSHYASLFIKNLNNENYYLDVSQEVKPNSMKAYLEFEDHDIESINKLISRDLKSKNIRLFSEYKFPVKVYGLHLTCEIKVQFLEQFTVDDKKRIVNNVLGDIESFNKKNEILKEGHYGLIHNVIEIKSQNRKGSSLSFIVDLGSSGELGLKCILESLNSLDVSVDFVEVK